MLMLPGNKCFSPLKSSMYEKTFDEYCDNGLLNFEQKNSE